MNPDHISIEFKQKMHYSQSSQPSINPNHTEIQSYSSPDYPAAGRGAA
jgi:hypothetical protein